MMVFLWSCFSAGTPAFDDFNRAGAATPAAMAPEAFVSRLPRRLLVHPNGGALAVVGRVERAWGTSFVEPGVRGGNPQNLGTFVNALRRILEGYPIGLAMDYFNLRYGELSSDLVAAMSEEGSNARELADRPRRTTPRITRSSATPRSGWRRPASARLDHDS